MAKRGRSPVRIARDGSFTDVVDALSAVLPRPELQKV